MSSADFLYPMIEGDETDAASLLADLERSADAKATTSAALTAATLDQVDRQLEEVAAEMARRFAAGGRLFTCGNGGSATDAAGVAALFTYPPHGDPLPARSLVSDESILTALSNDIGFEVVFSRQLIAHARAGDMVMGFSTSGNSPNVIKAFEEAARREVLTIGLAGYEGGAMAACDALVHCIVVRSDSVHRIQEAQSATAYRLWERVQSRLPAEVMA
ncbi:MAG TPA: SIS domain-containing protein [Nitriliruptorales bacterium]|nr:SIS domain-containing protein [Nitriliruptorales bacterium]